MIDLSQKLNYLDFTAKRIIQSVSVLYGTSESATLREAVNALFVEAYGSAPQNTDYPADIAGKLEYLNATKQRLLTAMDGLGYDVSGDITFREAANLLYADAIEVIADNVDVSSLPEYWGDDVKDALAYTLMLGTDEWVHHLVTTDNHFSKNYHNSVAMLELLQDTGLYSRPINLGDIADSNTESYWEEAFTGFGQWNGQLLFAMGNHDAQNNVGVSDFYDALISNDEEIVGQYKEHFSYYWDDVDHKIRYIVYDSYHYNTEGQETLREAVRTLPDGWSAIGLTHYWNKSDDIVVYIAVGRVPFIVNLAGHSHIDATWSKFGGIYRECHLSNDGNSNDAAGYEKVQGTNTEQAITILSINTRTKIAKYYRLGAVTQLGKQWERSYAFDFDSDNWVQGYYYNAGGIADTDSQSIYINTKRYPAVDENGNALNYYVYATNGGYCYQGHSIPFKADKSFFNARNSVVTSAAFNNIYVTGNNANTRWGTNNVRWILFSGNFPNITSTDDIVITTERPIINPVFQDIPWVAGKRINSSYNVEDYETGGMMEKAMSVTPGDRYHFWVDDEAYSDGYLYVHMYNALLNHANRYGVTATAKEVTFTVGSGEYYLIISGNNLANYIDKVHLDKLN